MQQVGVGGGGVVQILTDHDSGHGEQQRGDEGRRHHGQEHGKVGRRLGRLHGHLCKTGYGGGGGLRTTAVHTGWPPQRSINIHSASLIPDLINDVKAMTQQSLAQQRRPPHVNWLKPFPRLRPPPSPRLSRGNEFSNAESRSVLIARPFLTRRRGVISHSSLHRADWQSEGQETLRVVNI